MSRCDGRRLNFFYQKNLIKVYKKLHVGLLAIDIAKFDVQCANEKYNVTTNGRNF